MPQNLLFCACFDLPFMHAFLWCIGRYIRWVTKLKKHFVNRMSWQCFEMCWFICVSTNAFARKGPTFCWDLTEKTRQVKHIRRRTLTSNPNGENKKLFSFLIQLWYISLDETYLFSSIKTVLKQPKKINLKEMLWNFFFLFSLGMSEKHTTQASLKRIGRPKIY
jgi:hypothetical protein